MLAKTRAPTKTLLLWSLLLLGRWCWAATVDCSCVVRDGLARQRRRWRRRLRSGHQSWLTQSIKAVDCSVPPFEPSPSPEGKSSALIDCAQGRRRRRCCSSFRQRERGYIFPFPHHSSPTDCRSTICPPLIDELYDGDGAMDAECLTALGEWVSEGVCE